MLTRDLLVFVRDKLAISGAFDRNTKYSWAFAILQNTLFILSFMELISAFIKFFYITDKYEIFLMIVVIVVYSTLNISIIYLRFNKKKINEIFDQFDEIHKISGILLGKTKVEDSLFQWHKKFKKYVSIYLLYLNNNNSTFHFSLLFISDYIFNRYLPFFNFENFII